MLKSTDAGETWIPVRGWSEQTNTTSLCDVKVDPLNADVVYLVLDHDGSSTLTKTTNGGLTWRSTAFRDSHFGYLDLTFAPDHSRTLYVLSTARGVASLYKSFDGLKSVVLKWRFSDAYALAIDPKDDKHLFVLAHLHQLYESRDGGETWDTLDTSVLGKNVALSLAVDATGNIYLGTARNGIFMHGPWQHRIQISRSPALAPARTTKPGTKATNSTTNHRTAVPVSFLAGRQR
ncbi:MAG: hypothetical protein NTZ35_11975 [Ignavibacteriales bacterium]|nr:hypothetical protein [Ignavibacteriales bacterium]